MLCHWVFEVKVLDVDHEVIVAWFQYHAVPMKFGCCEVGCLGGYWSVKFKFVSSHFELHAASLFLLGPNVAYDEAVCDLCALGGFVPVDEKKC